MNTVAAAGPTSVPALDVRFFDDAVHGRLLDGQEVAPRREWFPRLRDATPEQRNSRRLIAGSIGIHWEDVDQDNSVSGLLRNCKRLEDL